MSTHSPQSSHLFSLISTLNALKELNIDIKAAVAVIEKGEGKKLVEKETDAKKPAAKKTKKDSKSSKSK